MPEKKPSTRQPGEILLAICSAALDREGMEAVAAALRLATLSKGDRHIRIVETRIDGNRIYGRYREMEEIRPGW